MPGHFASLEAIIEHYLDRRRSRGVLSAREAVTALQALMPDNPLSDTKLADLVVAAAIGQGRSVAFDMREEPLRARR